MKIRVINLHNASTVHYPLILIRGLVENYSTEVWRKHSKASHIIIIHNRGQEDSNANQSQRLITEVPMVKLKFKALLLLYPGENLVNFDFLGVKDNLRIYYRDLRREYFVRLVYIKCCDDDGRFQSPPELDNSVSAAVKKVAVAARVVQSCLAETLWTQGRGRNTFSLETEEVTGEPVVHIHQTALTRADSYRLSQDQLWETIGRELMVSRLGDKKVKYLAFLSSTRYHNPRRIKPLSHSVTLQMTRGHIALGGGGLALFGTGCLWTWPSTFSTVQSRLCDPSPVDPTLTMDDSGYRGTVGGCVATSLGSVLHELGHTWDLGHTDQGIMARGFDDLDSLLTLISERGGSRSSQSLAGRLTPCGNTSRGASPILAGHTTGSSQSARFTSVRRSDSVSQYLESYSEARLERSREEERGEGGCYWTRSCALILSHQPWIRPLEDEITCDGEITVSHSLVEACCLLAVLEVRGRRELVRHCWEPTSPTQSLTLEQEVLEEVRRSPDQVWQLLAMAVCGRLRKVSLSQI